MAKPLPRRPSATRVRIMGARYPYYLLIDSREGRIKEAKLSRKPPSEAPTYNNIRQGFVYERVPHITLKSIANNAESALSRLASCAMQGGGELPWEVTCRGVVDGIAMVIHMTRREGRRFVEESLRVQGYDAPRNLWLVEAIWGGHDEG